MPPIYVLKHHLSLTKLYTPSWFALDEQMATSTLYANKKIAHNQLFAMRLELCIAV